MITAADYTIGVNGCWNWHGLEANTSYGTMQLNGRPYPAYVHSYESIHGRITADQMVHHLCENKTCINPDHLMAMSRSQHKKLHGAMKRDFKEPLSTRVFGAAVPEEEYERFRQRFGGFYGASKWFINSALKEFNDRMENDPSLYQRVAESIEAMVQQNRLEKSEVE